MTSKTRLTLDLKDSQSFDTLILHRGDSKSRVIEIELTDNHAPVTLTSGMSATINASTNGIVVADGEKATVDTANNIISFTVTDNMTSLPGQSKISLTVTEGDTVITAQTFRAIVTDAVINEGSKFEPTGGTVKQFMDEIKAARGDFKNLAVAMGSKANKSTTLAGYGITDAYTSEKVDELLTKLGTKNFSFLRDSFGRIIDYTRDTRITSTSFKLYNSYDLSKGYSAWFGKTVTYVENGALYTANLKEIVCENAEAVLGSDYDDITIKKGENPYSVYYELVSLAKLYNEKADKATTLAGYGITDSYTINEVDALLTSIVSETKNNMQELVNTLPKCMVLPDSDNTRALYVDGRYLYNCHATNRAVTKCDIGIETDPKNIETIGGHPKTYPRGMAAGNGYLYVPYRDQKGGTGTSFDSTDVGGYLDIIKLSDFTLKEPIVYPRKPYDPGDGRGIRYYGKSHNAATYNNKYLCVTQQLGGWLLYDIETTPEKPTLLYECDNRAQSTIDNTEFQQPAFYTDGTSVFLAITGYDRHLLKIYNLNDPTYPICVYSGDLRELWQHGNTAYLHTMGLACRYPYIYCTVAPFPDSETVKYSTDFENTMQGVAVVDVSDINRVNVNFYKIPDESRTINSGGEPSPQSIAVTKNHLVMDMFDKGISVWSLANPAEPKFLGNLDTGATKVCSVMSTEDGRTFVGTEYQGGNLTMYRGL